MSATEVLQSFGIQPGEDVAHEVGDTPNYIDPNAYFEEATDLLKELRPVLDDEVIPELDEFADRWNPGGFMVFPLGLHASLGSLRLHVWPPNVERQTEVGPSIHSHAWHLASLVHRGIYSDKIFDLLQPDEQPEDGLRLYRSQRNTEGKDTLVTDGKIVEPVVRGERIIPEGGIHTIEAGIYHIPTVAVETTAVTLVLDSPAFRHTTGVLLGEVADEVARVRKPVTAEDTALAQSVILGSC